MLLLLPLPIPFSNVIPAWAILLVAGGLLERDGAFILAGHIFTVLAIAFFGVVGFFGLEAFGLAWRWMTGG